MYQLAYISTFGLSVTAADIEAILNTARARNRADEITGILIADGIRFLQVLEGDRQKVEAAFARIGKDPRHFGVYQLLGREVDHRDFGEWEMAYREVNNSTDADDLTRQAEFMTAGIAEGDIKERLRYFLRLDRQAL